MGRKPAPKAMLIDLHNHTWPRSHDSVLDPRDLVERARAAGLDGICVTEHDAIWDPADLRELCEETNFLVLPGVEISTDDGHILSYGVEKYVFGMHRVQTLADHVNERGGTLVAAHPYRRLMPWRRRGRRLAARPWSGPPGTPPSACAWRWSISTDGPMERQKPLQRRALRADGAAPGPAAPIPMPCTTSARSRRTSSLIRSPTGATWCASSRGGVSTPSTSRPSRRSAPHPSQGRRAGRGGAAGLIPGPAEGSRGAQRRPSIPLRGHRRHARPHRRGRRPGRVRGHHQQRARLCPCGGL